MGSVGVWVRGCRPTVLKQISRAHYLFRKSDGKFKNGKNKTKIFFSTSWFDILSKKEMFVFRLYNCCAFHFILYGNSSIIKEPIKICSDHLGFFDLHNISVVETVICAFNFQIEKTWWRQQSVNFIRARLSKHGWNLTLFESFCLVIIKDWRMSQIMQTGVTQS